MHTPAEAAFLTRYASWLGAGCIVEIGSWRGASAIALARGIAQQPASQRSMVYCIEPHTAFVGVYGGRFGPADRTAFYQNMLESGQSETIALINLPSLEAARCWRLPIGLLFIDGDHSQAAVEADVAAWEGHVIEGGYIFFDDAMDPAIGPRQAIAKLLAGGGYRHIAEEGKIVALQKLPDEAARKAAIRRETRERLMRQAASCGYDPSHAAARLAYGSFVSSAHRYVYVETPKAACTTLKHLVARLEGVAPDPDAPWHHRETRRDMRIHERQNFPIPTLLDLGPEFWDNLSQQTVDWFVFAMVRNPYSRLVSVFNNKVRAGEPGYRHLEARFGDRAPFAGPRAAFAAFVKEIVADPAAIEADAHLRPQASLLMPRLVPYRHIFKIEAMDKFAVVFADHLQRVAGLSLPQPGRHNAAGSDDWRSYYCNVTAEIVSVVYREDFEYFGYDARDWRSRDDADLLETDAVRRWRTEVVERNAVIDELYERLARR